MKKRVVSMVVAMALVGAITAPPAHAHRNKDVYLWSGVAVFAVVLVVAMVATGVIGAGIKKLKGSPKAKETSTDVPAADDEGGFPHLATIAKNVDVDEQGFTTVRIDW